jgi:hypothetical protein
MWPKEKLFQMLHSDPFLYFPIGNYQVSDIQNDFFNHFKNNKAANQKVDQNFFWENKFYIFQCRISKWNY